jgi:hypothetical protein
MRRGWLVTAALALVAVLRALTAPGAPPPERDSAALQAAIFREMTADETALRTDAARAFPGDPWSADDDFHNHQQRRARAIAARLHVSIGTVLRAVDDGLREHWPHANPAPLIATVPPCHPRPVY